MNRQYRKLTTIIVTLIIAALIPLMPFPPQFSQDALIMLAITVVAAVFWITECIPIALTGLVVILLQALFGIQSIGEGLRHIATPVNSIIFAGFTMAAGLSKYGLDRRLSLNIVAAMGERTDLLTLGIMIATAFLSMWISNSASAAIMMPIALGIVHMVNHETGRSNLGKVMMIGIAYGANIGGMGTPVGTPASSITIGLINELIGYQVTFLFWLIRALPVVILLIPIGCFILLRMYPPEVKRIEGGTRAVKEELTALGPMNRSQKKVLVLFVIAVLMWTADSFLPLLPGWLYIASVLIALMFLAPVIGVVSWEETVPQIGWDIFILVGGGLSLGAGLDSTGVVPIIADILSTVLSEASVLLVVTVIAFVTTLSITLFSSLTATSSTFVPVTISLGGILGLNPVVFAMVGGMASCCAFMLPANTPPNAIVYAAGYFKSYEMARAGIMFSLASSVILAVVFNLLWF
ncbi:MAG: SLC13 family permease [Spirochaetota bacterium]